MERNVIKIALLFAALFTCNCSAAAEQQGIPLVLVTPITGPSYGETIMLQDAKCRYFGKLGTGKGEPEPLPRKNLDILVGGGASWSIAVNRKVCGAVEAPIVLNVPLRNLVMKAGYLAGEKVIAYPDK